VLPLLHAYRTPQAPLLGAPAPTDLFQAAVRDARVGPDRDIPRISRELVEKYVIDLQNLGLLSNDSLSTASESRIS
jgi:fatty acid CoA ligase FadD9